MRLIDAEAFLKMEIDRCGSAPLVGTCTSDNEYLSDRLKKAPTIEAKPVVHGHWIEQEDGNLDTYYTCSSCKEDFDLIAGTPCENLYNYCPSCGAKMDEKEDKHEDYT